MTNLEKLSFPQRSEKIYKYFYKRDGSAWNSTVSSCTHTHTHTHHTHIYIYIYIMWDPSNSDYLLDHCTIAHLHFVGMIIQELPGGWYLYYQPANINGQLCSVLSNNLNLKEPTW